MAVMGGEDSRSGWLAARSKLTAGVNGRARWRAGFDPVQGHPRLASPLEGGPHDLQAAFGRGERAVFDGAGGQLVECEREYFHGFGRQPDLRSGKIELFVAMGLGGHLGGDDVAQ